MNLLIRQAHVLDPENKIDEVMDVVIRQGKIQALG